MGRVDMVKRQMAERSGKDFLPFFKFPDGKTDIRILPAERGADSEEWFTVVGAHYNVVDNKPLTCRYETYWAEDKCPICELVQEMFEAGEREEAKKLNVRRSYFVRGIVRGEEEKGVQLIRLPVTLFDSILEIIEDEDAFGDVLNAGNKGRDIRVAKSGQKLQTKYQAQALPKNRPLLGTKEEILELLNGLGSIDEIVAVPSYDELNKALDEGLGVTASGMGATADDDDDAEDLDTDDAIDIDDIDDIDMNDDEVDDDDDDDDSDLDDVDLDDIDDFIDEDDDDDDLPDLKAAVEKDQAEMKAGLQAELEDKKKTKKKGVSRRKKAE